jgi:hypothetical protein
MDVKSAKTSVNAYKIFDRDNRTTFFGLRMQISGMFDIDTRRLHRAHHTDRKGDP